MTSQRQKILMCAPDHYDVDYVINPWMEGQLGKTNRSEAHAQWQFLRNTLASEADITLIPAEIGVPDLVFTANAGIVLGDKVVVSRFRTAERQAEEPYFTTWFEQNGFNVLPWPKNVFFEGAGDALFDRTRPLLWCGYGFRSDHSAAALLQKVFARETVPLHLVDPRFYHLDTCLCPLQSGHLMYFPPAFDEESRQKIASIVPEAERIIVPEEDALHFACNAVELNDRLFLNDASPKLQTLLAQAGLKPKLTPLSEFLKAGGTAKCLTLKLVEP